MMMGDTLAWRILRLALIFGFSLCLVACQSFPRPDDAGQAPSASDRFILTSPEEEMVGQIQVIAARYEDTLPDIARRFDLGYEEIVMANPEVDPWLPGEGARIILPTRFVLPDAPRAGIVINLATLRLFYFPKSRPGEPQVVITHPVGIGRLGWTTPLGVTKVIDKDEAPTWYVPSSVREEHAKMGDPLPAVVPPGPDNPLGTHALRLALPSYLIHGTNKPYGVGMRVSHGCIRLYPEDIVSLYQQLPVGTAVRIVNQPFLAGWLGGTLYLETHPPLADDKRNKQRILRTVLRAGAAKAEDQPAIDWEKAKRLVDKPRGLPVPVLVGAPGLEEVLAGAREVKNAVTPAANRQKVLEEVPRPEPPSGQAAAGIRSGQES
jgi:L,D-transpeptidase ErfK/SrfK